MENVRYNISPCSAGEAQAFVSSIDAASFIPNGVVKANEKSHYDRYSFLCENCRVAVVYDTSACILSITGRQDHAKNLLDVFSPESKTVKRSTVPAQNSVRADGTQRQLYGRGDTVVSTLESVDRGKRAKLFVQPDSIRRRPNITPVPTIIATAKGAELSTDEIYPPQIDNGRQRHYSDNYAKDRTADDKTGYGGRSKKENTVGTVAYTATNKPVGNVKYGVSEYSRSAQGAVTRRDVDRSERGEYGMSISANTARVSDAPRRTTISFGDDEYSGYNDHGDFKVNTRVRTSADNNVPPADVAQDEPVKRKRGRPRKVDDRAQNDLVKPTELRVDNVVAPKYQNGYSIKNYRPDALVGALKRLKADGKNVTFDGAEFGGTPQEIKSYTVGDEHGQKVILRYATNKMTLQLQGKRSELFGEVQSQVSHDSDYSSALEGYVETTEDGGGTGKKKVSEVQTRLKKRLPTAIEFLSEPSRIDFSYGILDFGQAGLRLSDYSGLLVPAFRGLERFIFDLQRAEGINVKMIGQAYDKDDSGRYVLKSGYRQRIGSVIYAEVMVSLYTEYFSQRNFFAHSDNTNGNISRSISDRAVAKGIFDHLLDVVEYNSKKLKEIGFSVEQNGAGQKRGDVR